MAQLLQLRVDCGIELCATTRRLVGTQHAQEILDVAFERAEVGVDETDRVVDLVRHARRQLADRRQLLRMQQLIAQLGDLLIGIFQFTRPVSDLVREAILVLFQFQQIMDTCQ